LAASAFLFALLNDDRGSQGDTLDAIVSKSDSADKTDSSLPRRKNYPIGQWDIPVPYLNPFGSESSYASVQYVPNQYQELKYVDAANMEMSRMTGGDLWQLQVDWKDEKTDPWEDLRLYATELGGQLHMGT